MRGMNFYMKKKTGEERWEFKKDFKEFIDYTAEIYAEKTAFQYTVNKELKGKTFSEFKSDIYALGAYLYKNGYKNAKIAVIGENSYEWVLTYFTSMVGSCVIEPLDKELGDGEVFNLLNAGECDLLIYSAKKQKTVDGFDKEALHTKSFICMSELEGLIGEGKALIEGGYDEYEKNTVNEEELAAIIFTSGTTGTPKGVMLSQKNLIADTYRSCGCMSIPPESTVAVLPLNHTFGFMACIICQMLMGHRVYLNNSLKTLIKDIQLTKPAHISVVPLFVENFYKNIWRAAEKSGKAKMLRKMIKVSNFLRKLGIDKRKLFFKSVIDNFGGNLEMIISGGAPIDDMYMKGFDDLGITIINGYGITECSPIVALNRNDNIKYGTVGNPIPTVEIKIDNPNSDGEGEILVKGDIVMMGYYKNEEETARVLRDGWFYTGDIGKYEDGFLSITGRKKNLILLDNGKNVYPEELENLISHIENVAEVLVYEENNLITAEIYVEPENSSEEIKNKIREDIAEMNKKITSYKNVRSVKFRDTEFVKTTTKKIKRNYK